MSIFSSMNHNTELTTDESLTTLVIGATNQVGVYVERKNSHHATNRTARTEMDHYPRAGRNSETEQVKVDHLLHYHHHHLKAHIQRFEDYFSCTAQLTHSQDKRDMKIPPQTHEFVPVNGLEFSNGIEPAPFSL